MVRHDAPDVRVESVLPLKAIRHIAASTEHELAPLTAAYRAFRCAFPDRTNDWLERASEVRTTLLTRALRNKQPFVVYHPERGSLRALFEAMAGVCGAGAEQAAAAVRPLQTAASGS